MAIWPFTRRKTSKSSGDVDSQPAVVAREELPMFEKEALFSPRPAQAPLKTPNKPRAALPRSATTPMRDITRAASPVVQKAATFDMDSPPTAAVKRKTLVKRPDNNSRSSLAPDADFTAVPTLQPSTQDGKSMRSRKSIRSKGDVDRFRSLRQSTSPIPIPQRPASIASADIMVRETRRLSNGFGRPASQVSLPLVESLNDEFLPDTQESTSYKVNAFDVLAPRPTIKYSQNSRSATAFARKDREPPIPEGDFGPKARINELADDMDARALRELMDRDRRRRERKKKLDTEQLARKLEEKGEKEDIQREKSRGRSRSKSKSKSKSKGKRKDKGKEREKAQADLPTLDTSMDRRRSRSATPEALPTLAGPLVDNPFLTSEDLAELPVSPVHQKFRESRYSPVSPVDDPFAEPYSTLSEKDEPVIETIETAKAVRLSQASMSPPASPILAKYPTRQTEGYESATPDIPEVPEPQSKRIIAIAPGRPQEGSEPSSGKASGGWSNFFRRTKTKSRNAPGTVRDTPSESGFSTTSRESFGRVGQGTGPVSLAHRSFKRSDTPQRTQSKFREDLPDARRRLEASTAAANTSMGDRPMSPPRSPPTSPGASADLSSPPSPFVDRAEMLSTDAAINAPMDIVHPALRGEVTLSRHQSMRSNNGYSAHRDSGPPAALLSQSLASVDSEGSWLSGRPSQRSSSITERNAWTGSKTSLPLDAAEQETMRGSPLIFGRRISNPGARAGHQAQSPGTGSISTQLTQLRRPEATGATGVNPGSTAATPPEGSKPPTPIALGEGQGSEADRDAVNTGSAVLHTSGVARKPTLVKRDRDASGRPRSSAGLLDSFEPQASSATIETVTKTSPTPSAELGEKQLSRESGHTGDSEEDFDLAQAEVADMTEIKRATSVKLSDRTHARHISGGSARLLDLPARNSPDHLRGKRDSMSTPVTPRIPDGFRAQPSESEEEHGDE